MRIWLSTAPPASRLKGAGGGTVDNRNQRQGLHLRNPKTCPNKPGHLYHPAAADQAVRWSESGLILPAAVIFPGAGICAASPADIAL